MAGRVTAVFANPQRNYLMTRIRGVSRSQLATMMSRRTLLATRINRGSPAVAQLKATLPIPGSARYTTGSYAPRP